MSSPSGDYVYMWMFTPSHELSTCGEDVRMWMFTSSHELSTCRCVCGCSLHHMSCLPVERMSVCGCSLHHMSCLPVDVCVDVHFLKSSVLPLWREWEILVVNCPIVEEMWDCVLTDFPSAYFCVSTIGVWLSLFFSPPHPPSMTS